jgi:hypothetical protein
MKRGQEHVAGAKHQGASLAQYEEDGEKHCIHGAEVALLIKCFAMDGVWERSLLSQAWKDASVACLRPSRATFSPTRRKRRWYLWTRITCHCHAFLVC